MKRLLLLAAIASLSACNLDTSPPDNPSHPADETYAASLKVDISTMTKTAHDVYYKDIVVGNGATLTTAQQVTVSYGAFVKTGAVFDRGDHVPLQVTSLTPGLQEGMSGMKVGTERLIIIPSNLGFGNNPVGSVPPNSTLIYDILLFDFQ